MLFFHLAFALLGAFSRVSANPENIPIPQVSSVVSSQVSAFAPAVTYAGPTGSASAALKTATSSTSNVAPQVLAAAATAAPYWLESIAHQGISAFNSNPATYQVFRNVKSFGARGESSSFNPIDREK